MGLSSIKFRLFFITLPVPIPPEQTHAYIKLQAIVGDYITVDLNAPATALNCTLEDSTGSSQHLIGEPSQSYKTDGQYHLLSESPLSKAGTYYVHLQNPLGGADVSVTIKEIHPLPVVQIHAYQSGQEMADQLLSPISDNTPAV